MADATTPPPLPAAGTPSSNRGVMIVLSYLWLLALVPLLVEKDDKDVQWHAKHGVVLMLAELILWIAMYIVQAILGTILGCLFALLTFPVGLAIIAVHILAIVKGLNGGRLIIPGVSQYADRL
ncbi:MAG: hypothetical protein JNL48_16405 [Acidobacteria bacterium]|nr:hypothetical protein [Acidobacteriota bacterium]